MPSDRLFGPSLGSDRLAGVVSDEAWLQAMLDVEAALARVQARLGLVPESSARVIAEHCRATEYDAARIGRDAVESANPVIPLVTELRQKVGANAAPHVHRGATSQDILDTAMMLIARRAIAVLVEDLSQAAAAAASLAERHRSTVMAGRTLLQQASVTTFGLKAAGWLVAMVGAREGLERIRGEVLAVQFGGAVGTLDGLADRGLEVAGVLAVELELCNPALPWHTDRGRIVELAAAVARAAGAAGKVALDVVLLAQSEVGEARERRRAGHGGSSSLPQKQNPVEAIEILAAVRGVTAQAGLLFGAILQEHERAAGAWQAEWPAVAALLAQAGGATGRLAALLGSLEVDPEQMRRNLGLTGGLIMAEHVVTLLAERTDALTARQLVDAAVSNATRSGRPFEEVLRATPAIAEHLGADGLRTAMNPSAQTGAASALIDRALAYYRDRGKSAKR